MKSKLLNDPTRIVRITSGSPCRATTARMAPSTTGRAITVCSCGPTLIADCRPWRGSEWWARSMRRFRETGDDLDLSAAARAALAESGLGSHALQNRIYITPAKR